MSLPPKMQSTKNKAELVCQDLALQKSQLRESVKLRLRQMDDNERRLTSVVIVEKLLELPELQSAGVVFCFVGVRGEVHTRPLIESLLKSGKKVCVPRCYKGGVMDARLINSLDNLVPRPPFDIPEPDEGAELVLPAEIDFAIVPGLAFDRKGGRLGKGAGYYDRYLKLSRAVRCGVCLDEMLFSEVPTDAFDMMMDIIVTEKSILRI